VKIEKDEREWMYGKNFVVREIGVFYAKKELQGKLFYYQTYPLPVLLRNIRHLFSQQRPPFNRQKRL
jgi:hypothetical protein